jgi:hypothetical protein
MKQAGEGNSRDFTIGDNEAKIKKAVKGSLKIHILLLSQITCDDAPRDDAGDACGV